MEKLYLLWEPNDLTLFESEAELIAYAEPENVTEEDNFSVIDTHGQVYIFARDGFKYILRPHGNIDTAVLRKIMLQYLGDKFQEYNNETLLEECKKLAFQKRGQLIKKILFQIKQIFTFLMNK